ncbi:MAG: glycosyltransferase [Bacteroidia bacterium]|nr:glycosyltransferase [Bacteroidia bacterium]
MSVPLVSVILPVYNAEKYVGSAIQSILDQSYSNFELLVIEDGSTDRSLEIIRSFTDKRIVVIENNKNIGLVASLNKGIESSRGTYIARMDADDESMPERFKKQVEYLELHPDIGVLGTATLTFGSNRSVVTRYLPTHDGLLTLLFFNSCMCHPSVMMRRRVLDSDKIRYDETYRNAEDYDMWTRLAALTKLANLHEPLLKYRIHETQITRAQKAGVNSSATAIRKRQLKFLHLEPSAREIEIHDSIAQSNAISSVSELSEMEQWLIRLVNSNLMYKVVSPEVFSSYITDIWLDLCARSGEGMHHYKIAMGSVLAKDVKLISPRSIRTFVKMFI